MDSLARPKRLTDLPVRELPDGDVIVLQLEGSKAIVLNVLAGAILDLCDGSRTIEEMVTFLCEHVPGVTRAVVLEDVRALIAQLIETGVLEVQGA